MHPSFEITLLKICACRSQIQASPCRFRRPTDCVVPAWAPNKYRNERERRESEEEEEEEEEEEGKEKRKIA